MACVLLGYSWPIPLRDYQSRALEGLRAGFRSRSRRLCLVLPTGGGKTRIAAAMAAGAVARGRRVLFVAHLRELITQARDRFEELGLEAGLVLAGHEPRPELPIQVGSIQTLSRRVLPPADLVILDECHRAAAASYRRLLEALPAAWTVGLTATPERGDGRGLEDVFEGAVIGATAADLMGQGVLMRPRVFAPALPDLEGVRVSGGDYAADDLERLLSRREIVGDLVATWQKLAAGRRTVAFAATVAHSQAIAAAFNEAGIAAEHVDGETGPEERAAIFARLAAGETLVLSNVGVLCEGWDLPVVEAAILARPTRSRGLYVQQVGRALRAAPGKSDAIVLDHAGCALAHGLPEEYSPRNLAGWAIASESEMERRKATGPKACPSCHAVAPRRAASAQACGHVFALEREALAALDARGIAQVEGALEELRPSARRKRSPEDLRHENREVHLAHLVRVARNKGYKPEWALYRFRGRYGELPTIAQRVAAGWDRLKEAVTASA